MNQDVIVTEAGKRLLDALDDESRWTFLGGSVTAETAMVAAIEAEAAQRALDDVRARVEALQGWDSGTAALDCVRRSEVLSALQDRGADREDVKHDRG